MPDLTAPGGTSVGITRLGRPAAAQSDDLGPLAALNGTWFGSHGWELIAVPHFQAGPKAFRLILRPYIEVISFQPIGAPVPDRGATDDIFITGLMYDMRICDAETNEPLHLETGMWFSIPTTGADLEVARSSTIPHGDAMLAIGTATTSEGPPSFPDASAVPDVHNPPLGYLDVYLNQPGPFKPGDVNATLAADNEGLNIVSTTSLSVSTEPPGGILNIPFVDQNANATQFTGTYWIETIQDPQTGDQVMQLQYSQQTNLDFIEQPDGSGLIMWPHVNVNTLRKQ